MSFPLPIYRSVPDYKRWYRLSWR